jgi:hypothetical protein
MVRRRKEKIMIRLARLAMLPVAAAALLLGAGTAGASVAAAPGGVSPLASCSGTFTSGGATVTVRCDAGVAGNEFRAAANCPNGDTHFGPWVLQGPGHVSVASCANPMVGWGFDLR